MPKYSQAAIALLFGFQAVPLAPSAWADECEGILKVARVVKATSSDQSSIEQHASNFCNEFREAQLKGKSVSASASYKFLSASYGQQNVSSSEIASRYCSADASGSAKKEAYENYIESVAPGAFGAYIACKGMANRDVRFSIDPNAVLPDELSVLISYLPQSGGSSAEVIVKATKGVSCKWDGSTGAAVEGLLLEAGKQSQAMITCTREKIGEQAFVSLYRKDRPEAWVTLPWRKFDKDGNPVDTLRTLAARLEQLEASNAQLVDQATSVEDRISKLTTSLTSQVNECSAPPGGGGANCNAECGSDQRVVSGSCTLLAGGGSIQNFGANGNGWACLWGAGVVSGVTRGRAVAICATNK